MKTAALWSPGASAAHGDKAFILQSTFTGYRTNSGGQMSHFLQNFEEWINSQCLWLKQV